jgi:hypothetical protein
VIKSGKFRAEKFKKYPRQTIVTRLSSLMDDFQLRWMIWDAKTYGIAEFRPYWPKIYTSIAQKGRVQAVFVMFMETDDCTKSKVFYIFSNLL